MGRLHSAMTVRGFGTACQGAAGLQRLMMVFFFILSIMLSLLYNFIQLNKSLEMIYLFLFHIILTNLK